MGMLIMAGERVSPDPGTPDQVIEQGPTIHEQWNEMLHSEMGGLGGLFGHSPTEHYPAPLETSPEPQLEPGQLAAMQAGASMAATESPQPTPEPQIAATPSRWTFADTLKNEVLKARNRVQSLRGTNG